MRITVNMPDDDLPFKTMDMEVFVTDTDSRDRILEKLEANIDHSRTIYRITE